jgi:hypothetical protein
MCGGVSWLVSLRLGRGFRSSRFPGFWRVAHPCAVDFRQGGSFYLEPRSNGTIQSRKRPFPSHFRRSMLERLVNSTAMLSSRMKSLQTAITAFLCDLCVLGGKSISGFRSFALSYKQPTKSNLITPLFSAATCHCSSPFVTLRAVSPLLATYEKPPRVHPFPPTQT